MARRTCGAGATLGVVLALPAAALGQADAGADKEHETLRALKEVYEQAVSGNKLDLLAPHLDPGFSGVMVTGEKVSSLAEMQAYWQKMRAMIGEGGTYTVTLEPERSQIDGDVAVAKGTTQDVVVTGAGKEYRFGTQWTAVCRKREGAWKLVRVHGSMDPLMNVFVQAAVKESATLAGAAALAVGLVLGVIVGRLSKRPKAA